MIESITQAIKEAESNGALFKAETPRGFSGDKIIGALQRLCALFSDLEDACYLEIGIFQGLTLLSVAKHCRDMLCIGIDNFTFIDPQHINFDVVKNEIARLELSNVMIINKDYEDAFENLKNELGNKKIAVYFIDGPHDYRSQLMCLELALPYLHENAAILIDDCNYRHIRQASRDFLVTHPDWKLIFEAYTPCHPDNMEPLQNEAARSGWWNGVNILVRDEAGELKPMYPPTERSRVLFENEHLIHSARIAEIMPDAVNFIQAIFSFNIYRMIRKFVRLILLFLKKRGAFRKRFSWLNTYSDHLPGSNYNNPPS